jgi:hypothetical protein
MKQNVPVLCVWMFGFVSVPERKVWIDFFLGIALRYIFGVEDGLVGRIR